MGLEDGLSVGEAELSEKRKEDHPRHRDRKGGKRGEGGGGRRERKEEEGERRRRGRRERRRTRRRRGRRGRDTACAHHAAHDECTSPLSLPALLLL